MELDVDAEGYTVEEVVAVAEAIPDQEESVGSAAIRVEELFVSTDCRASGHGEIRIREQPPLLLILTLFLFRILHQLDRHNGLLLLPGFIIIHIAFERHNIIRHWRSLVVPVEK